MIRGARYSTRFGPPAILGESESGALVARNVVWGPVVAAIIVVLWALGIPAGFQISLLVLTILGLLAVIAGLRYPAIGLFGVVALCVLDAPARVYILTGGLLRWNTLNYWFLLMMVLYAPFLFRLRDPHSITLAVFICLLVLELLISPDIANGVQNILGIISVFGILIYFARAGHDPRMLFWLSLNGGLLGALGGLVYFLQRITLPSINENAWATFPLTAVIAVVLGFPAAARLRRGQAVLMVLAATNMVWIFLSGSRGALAIGTCCFVVLILALRGVRQRTMALAAAWVIVFAAAAHFGELQDRAIHRLTKLFTTEHGLAGNYTLAGRTSGRSDLAIGGWYIFQQHPMGVGTGGFADSWAGLGRHYSLVYRRGEQAPAHSGWVKTLVENGIPGIVLLFAYVCSFGLAAMKQRSWELWRLGMLTSAVLGAALLTTEFQTKGIWLLAAAATAFLYRERVEAAMYASDDRERQPLFRRAPAPLPYWVERG